MFEYTESVSRFGVFEACLSGPSDGNPFIDYSIQGLFVSKNETVTVDGFYDGDGIYKLRYMPSFSESYHLSIKNNWSNDDALVADFTVSTAKTCNHGPVRVARTFHFAYEDGTPYYPVGTTCYVWQLQSEELQKQTIKTLQDGTFNKIRFCVFPKHYTYNLKEPVFYPYELRPNAPWQPSDFNNTFFANAPRTVFGGIQAMIENPDLVWDYTRFNPSYFKHLERSIQALGELGIEADLILMHPYDRWGYSKMGTMNENFYLKYIVARLSAYHNVWWSMANEFDLFRSKSIADWESNAATVCVSDPYRHLRSIHNCMTMYDHTRGWITHCSLQRIDLYKTAECTSEWRERYQKPCVLDEIAYEGNISHGWGNISGEEMTRRFWEAFTRGGYGQHGETYENPDDILWWSHGGKLHGTSPERIHFLRKIMNETPGLGMEPAPSRFDETAICYTSIMGQGSYYIYYHGANRPSSRTYYFPDENIFEVEVIDTWNMIITPLGKMQGTFTVPLLGKPYIAVRLIRTV